MKLLSILRTIRISLSRTIRTHTKCNEPSMNFQKEGEKKERERKGGEEKEKREVVVKVLRSKSCVDWLLKKEGHSKNKRLMESKPETETESLNVCLSFQKS